MLGLIELEPGLPMEKVFTYTEIYAGSKIGHFGELRRNSGVAYADMIFFDDWDENCNEVGSLGVACVECQQVRAEESVRIRLQRVIVEAVQGVWPASKPVNECFFFLYS